MKVAKPCSSGLFTNEQVNQSRGLINSAGSIADGDGITVAPLGRIRSHVHPIPPVSHLIRGEYNIPPPVVDLHEILVEIGEAYDRHENVVLPTD